MKLSELKPYPPYPELLVSKSGKIFQLKRSGKIFERKLHLDPMGYWKTTLGKNGKQINLFVHRLIAICFIENPLNKPVVNHKDGIKGNNSISNLEWTTRSENSQHAIDNKLYETAKGEAYHRSNLQEKDIILIRKMGKEGKLYHRQIAKMFGVSRSLIGHIIHKKRWMHV